MTKHFYIKLSLLFLFFSLLSGDLLAQIVISDDFSSGDYSGGTGWKSDWGEGNDRGNANGGLIRISGRRLQFNEIDRNGQELKRTVDLNVIGAVSARLEFDWETMGLDGSGSSAEELTVQISRNVNGPFTTLGSFKGTQSGKFDQDITNYISGNTTIRFVNAGTWRFGDWESDEYAYVDNIEISYTSGIPEQSFWYKADTGVGGNVSSWADQSGNGNNANNSGSVTRVDSDINFNPSLSFNSVNRQFPVAENSTVQTFVIVNKTPSSAIVGNDLSGLIGANGDKGVRLANQNVNPLGPDVTPYHSWKGDDNSDDWINSGVGRINGVVDADVVHDGKWHIANMQRSAPLTGSYYLGGYYNGRSYNGNIAEVIAFKGTVSNPERVESYLAIKYGITLGDAMNPVDYQDASGTIIWSGSTTFQHNVAGIGRENTYGLHQKVSSSINTTPSESSDIIMAIDNDFVSSNQDATRSDLTDGQFLIWGHNNEDVNVWTTTGNYKHVDRIWKVQNTNNVGEVHVQINLSGYAALASSGEEYSLIVDTDTDLTNGGTTIYSLSVSGSDDLYTTSLAFTSSTSYFTIIAVDTEAPTIACPVDQDVAKNNSCEYVLPDYTGVTVTDNVDATPTVTQRPVAGTVVTNGTVAVTLTATDASSNTSECTFTLTILDNIDPVINAVSDINAVTSTDGTDDCAVSIAVGDANISDNCSTTLSWTMTGAVKATGTGQVGTYTFPIGTTTITYTVSDGTNTATDNLSVTVSDNEKPVIQSCPTDIVVAACNNSVTWEEPTATDNCTVNLTSTHNSGDSFTIGTTTTVTYTATDNAGNTAECSFNVTVLPEETISTSAAKNPICSGETTTLSVDAYSISFDGGDDYVEVPNSNSINEVSNLAERTTMLKFNADDVTTPQMLYEEGGRTNGFAIFIEAGEIKVYAWNNDKLWGSPITSSISVNRWYHVAYTWNNASKQFKVYLDGVLIDQVTGNTMPAHPGDITLGASGRSHLPDGTDIDAVRSYYFKGEIDEFRLWNTELNQSQIQTEMNSSDPLNNGLIVHYDFNEEGTIADNAGGDNNGVINGGLTFTSEFTVEWRDQTNTVIANTPNVDVTPLITTTYTATVTHENGCQTSEDVTVTVNQLPDLSSFDFSVPASVCTNTSPTLIVTGLLASTNYTIGYNDNGTSRTENVTTDGSGAAELSTNPITADGIYNIESVAFNDGATNCEVNPTPALANKIAKIDNVDPILSCVSNQTRSADVGQCYYTVLGTEFDLISYSDDCTVTTVVNDFNGGSTLDGAQISTGTTTIVWTVTDNEGNSNACSFDVIVIDDEKPIIANCPADITVGACNNTVTWTVPTVTDNCSATLANAHNSGDTFPVGTTIVTYTATDVAGNTEVCSFNVTVLPVITISLLETTSIVCNGDNAQVTINAGGGDGTYTYSSDNVTYQASNVFSLPAGTHTLYVKDGNNCIAQEDITINEPAAITTSLVISTSNICFGDEGVITIENYETDVTYSLFEGVSSLAFTSSVSGSDLILTIDNTVLNTEKTYNITIRAERGGCTLDMDTDVSITVEHKPNPSGINF